MYAIVEISGKQYKVRENERLFVPRLADDADSKISFDRVLLVSGDDAIRVGTPTVEGAEVEATVLAHVKADKVLVFKKKRRKRYRVKRGHRQPYTELLIDRLTLDGKGGTKKAAKPKKKAAESEAPKKAATKAEAPKKAATKAEAPKKAAPKAEAPKKAAPKAEAPKKAATKAEAPKKAAPKAEAPKKAAPKAEAPKKAAPKAEAPKKAATKAEAPKKATTKAEAPKKAATKAKAPKKAATKAKKSAKGDDLTKIEGIGPKTAQVFAAAGIDSFATLASSEVEKLKEILDEAGPRMRALTPDTWPEQAALAAAGDWDALKKLQDELDGGRRS